ncbi:hypothetical protein HDU85_002079 [Gaertneriomyces sp. JEL0708]|nr:hypothetical protein HDU85_002079 [Gaertneriomyces sp. JEL0708]
MIRQLPSVRALQHARDKENLASDPASFKTPGRSVSFKTPGKAVLSHKNVTVDKENAKTELLTPGKALKHTKTPGKGVAPPNSVLRTKVNAIPQTPGITTVSRPALSQRPANNLKTPLNKLQKPVQTPKSALGLKSFNTAGKAPVDKTVSTPYKLLDTQKALEKSVKQPLSQAKPLSSRRSSARKPSVRKQSATPQSQQLTTTTDTNCVSDDDYEIEYMPPSTIEHTFRPDWEPDALQDLLKYKPRFYAKPEAVAHLFSKEFDEPNFEFDPVQEYHELHDQALWGRFPDPDTLPEIEFSEEEVELAFPELESDIKLKSLRL